MQKRKIALVAHDGRKDDLLQWIKEKKDILLNYNLCATGTTGLMIEKALGITVEKFLSGPLGGDLQIGSRMTEGEIDVLVFFWDPLHAQPHDPDVKALLRIAVVWNVPIACNKTSADLIFSSPLLSDVNYERKIPDFSIYLNRKID